MVVSKAVRVVSQSALRRLCVLLSLLFDSQKKGYLQADKKFEKFRLPAPA